MIQNVFCKQGVGFGSPQRCKQINKVPLDAHMSSHHGLALGSRERSEDGKSQENPGPSGTWSLASRWPPRGGAGPRGVLGSSKWNSLWETSNIPQAQRHITNRHAPGTRMGDDQRLAHRVASVPPSCHAHAYLPLSRSQTSHRLIQLDNLSAACAPSRRALG